MLEFGDTIADPVEYLRGGVPGVMESGDSENEASISAVIDYVRARGFAYEPWQVSTFITAVRTKPFVILAGISGTGKTKLPQLVAEATDAIVDIVPVRPDWTDSSDILGYERLNGDFVPGRLLELCRRAIDEPDRQFFLILDEMNVARVEYYFAEVLSAMENRRHDGDRVVTDALMPSAADDWQSVYLPQNLCIVGTVNMDETTHGFSRKVLDRSFVLELSQVDLSDVVTVQSTAPTATRWPVAAWAVTVLRLAESPDAGTDEVKQVIQALTRANEALQRAQLQIGYRVRDEIAMFCLNARAFAGAFVASDETVVSPLDLCLNMKILPRIQGGGGLVRAVLDDLARWTEPLASDAGVTEEPSGFPFTAARVVLMKERLDQLGFTSFWL